jgi:putative acetyltransferase
VYRAVQSHRGAIKLSARSLENRLPKRWQMQAFPAEDTPMKIAVDDLTHPAVVGLLNEHLTHMYSLGPPETVFALDLEKLRTPDITFWTAWEGDMLMGCGALKQLTPHHAEIKSMRTPARARGKGAARALMQTIVETARQRQYERLSLETGTHPDFTAAHRLYEQFGFEFCGPFADYEEGPHSVFMTLQLRAAS